MLPRLWSTLNDWSKQRYQSNYEAAVSVEGARRAQPYRAPVKLSWLICGFPQPDQEALFQRLSVQVRAVYISKTSDMLSMYHLLSSP